MIGAIKTAFKNLTKEPLTHGYPNTPIEKPKNYRGLIEYNKEFCIFCDKCEKACPPGAILFEQLEDGTKIYNYNPHLCIYCGDCITSCPKSGDALIQSEKKPMPALKEEGVNDNWFELEKRVKKSREDYKENCKKAKDDVICSI